MRTSEATPLGGQNAGKCGKSCRRQYDGPTAREQAAATATWSRSVRLHARHRNAPFPVSSRSLTSSSNSLPLQLQSHAEVVLVPSPRRRVHRPAAGSRGGLVRRWADVAETSRVVERPAQTSSVVEQFGPATMAWRRRRPARLGTAVGQANVWTRATDPPRAARLREAQGGS